jgi:hypothetical protein
MRFSLFMYCTVGRRAELEAGMAGRNPELYQRMLGEIAEYVRFADDAGYFGFGHPEHHLQIEGFEISNDPRLMSMAGQALEEAAGHHLRLRLDHAQSAARGRGHRHHGPYAGRSLRRRPGARLPGALGRELQDPR